MSTKCSIKYCNTENIEFHLFSCFVKGYALDIRVGDMKNSIRIHITKEEAKKIEEQLNEL